MQWKFVLMAVLVCVMSVSHAQAYKWVDENGKVHYSDIPRDGAQKGIRHGSDATEEKSSQQQIDQQRRNKRDKLLRAFDEERRIKREKETKQKNEQQKKERECARARKEYANMQKGGVYYKLDKDGKHQYMSDTEVKKNIAEWEHAVEHWCK